MRFTGDLGLDLQLDLQLMGNHLPVHLMTRSCLLWMKPALCSATICHLVDGCLFRGNLLCWRGFCAAPSLAVFVDVLSCLWMAFSAARLGWHGWV